MLQDAITDLKNYFEQIVGLIGVEFSVFSITRQREVLHTVDRIKFDVFPTLEKNYVDVHDFNLVFYGFTDLIQKIQKIENGIDLKTQHTREQLYQNLKTMALQVNSHVQNFSL